ncbi:hypothetical protein Tcan_18207 [Toxocara canis]|uniref:Uncharacterized protein n=1 Tax=Toxocara canis TaxID=6265 RepID=A0A0B2V340_TOXCA|nr:hypothetical protein Tcan_18207 [Toxocara canis]
MCAKGVHDEATALVGLVALIDYPQIIKSLSSAERITSNICQSTALEENDEHSCDRREQNRSCVMELERKGGLQRNQNKPQQKLAHSSYYSYGFNSDFILPSLVVIVPSSVQWASLVMAVEINFADSSYHLKQYPT